MLDEDRSLPTAAASKWPVRKEAVMWLYIKDITVFSSLISVYIRHVQWSNYTLVTIFLYIKIMLSTKCSKAQRSSSNLYDSVILQTCKHNVPRLSRYDLSWVHSLTSPFWWVFKQLIIVIQLFNAINYCLIYWRWWWKGRDNWSKARTEWQMLCN